MTKPKPLHITVTISSGPKLSLLIHLRAEEDGLPIYDSGVIIPDGSSFTCRFFLTDLCQEMNLHRLESSIDSSKL